MSRLIQQLLCESARRTPDNLALTIKQDTLTYQQLWHHTNILAHHIAVAGIRRSDRIGVYLPKQFETVISFFATWLCDAVLVPINPLLKPPQVEHILRDSGLRLLITSGPRWQQLEAHGLAPEQVLLTDAEPEPQSGAIRFHYWHNWQGDGDQEAPQARNLETDLAAILYTSGSTGRPKGVVLSHRNMVAGAESVAEYLNNSEQDRILALLPFSFDYGLNQLTTSCLVGASLHLHDYLLPQDVVRVMEQQQITGLAAVPPLWQVLARQSWGEPVRQRLRYFTNSGGALPPATVKALREIFPRARPYLMYGLTEAFRSTFLPPEWIDSKPGSIGKAIPNVEILVVDDTGNPCPPYIHGELVHRGPLVSQGYWNNPELTAKRFRPFPHQLKGVPHEELAVWSGDTVYADSEGFLFFVGRNDEMIKTSGYRVSPTEVEEVAFASGCVAQTAAIGVPHPNLGQAIVLCSVLNDGRDEQQLKYCLAKQLPAYMQPQQHIFLDKLPLNGNGKLDRTTLKARYLEIFTSDTTP